MSGPPPTKEAGAAKRPQNRPANKEVGSTNTQNESLTQSFGRNGHDRQFLPRELLLVIRRLAGEGRSFGLLVFSDRGKEGR
jgi:hypothetical protein